jgi:hypothetical protein
MLSIFEELPLCGHTPGSVTFETNLMSEEDQNRVEDGGYYVQVEVITGEGATSLLELPAMSTVLTAKTHMECKLGIRQRDMHMFDAKREEELQDVETLRSLLVGEGTKLEISLLVVRADAQQVVQELATEAGLVLGDGTAGSGDDQLNDPMGVAFIAAYPDWLVTTEDGGHRIKISNSRTGALLCKLGEEGQGQGQFLNPGAVVATSDSSFVLVAEYAQQRVQMLRLTVEADRSSAALEFIRFIGSTGEGREDGSDSAGQLRSPFGMALLLGQDGCETLLVTEEENHRVSQFSLDGTFIRIFAGSGVPGSGDGEFNGPDGITVLGASEVGVADYHNDRVQIFDNSGFYLRQFGSSGGEADGQFDGPTSLASDAHGNILVTDKTRRLQVFSPEGRHLCTRNDIGLNDVGITTVAWSSGGGLAIANGRKHTVLVWHELTY